MLWTLTQELGWLHLYPEAEGFIDLPNWAATHFYDDDLDYLGGLCIVYNACAAYQISEEKTSGYPALKRNIDRFTNYRKLRDDGYFSLPVRNAAQKSEGKYRVVEKSLDNSSKSQKARPIGVSVKKNMSYNLQQFERLTILPYDLENETVEINNPFYPCRPFIRLEARHTGTGYDDAKAIVIAGFDKKNMHKEQIELNFKEALDLKGKEALGLYVLGSGKGFLTLSMKSGFSDNYMHRGLCFHILPLNFSGWKYITLCEPNNGDFPQLLADLVSLSKERFVGFVHKYMREIIDYAKISQITIDFHDGAEGICLGDIKAMPVSREAVAKPGVCINGHTLRFDCDLKPGSYLEYELGMDHALVYDEYGKSQTCGVDGETPEIPSGASSVTLLGKAEGTRRLAGHIIVYGDTLTN